MSGVLTSGERAVWAAMYAQWRSFGKPVVEAARLAALAVKDLRSLRVHGSALLSTDEDARAMLDAMLGVPR